MADNESFEFFQIRFNSWERKWLTGSTVADTLDDCFCLLPGRYTNSIRNILQMILWTKSNSSVPYSPFGLRIRHRNTCGTTSDKASELMKAAGDYQSEIAQCVPDWNECLRVKRLLLKNGPKEITTRYGERLRPPLGNTPINHAYSVECLTLGRVKQLGDLRASSFKYWPK
jgi:hypothetical protein